jgi:DedD protein
MAFFKFRKAADEAAPAKVQTESVDVLRKRARHRLIGAVVLVLVAVVGFPLVFDTQPRPVPVDIPIAIPDRNKVKPLAAPVAASTPAVSSGQVSAPPVATGASAPTGKVTAAEGLDPKEELVATPTPSKSAPPAKAEPKPEPKAEPKAVAKTDDGARAKALLEGQSASTKSAASGERYVVQVGAFADAVKAREVRLKVERAGMKTYTQVVETKDGKRIRVRVGPFDAKAEADKVAGKLKGLDLPAAILTL